MTNLRTHFVRKQKELNIPWFTLERDYLQSWILLAISDSKDLKSNLIFKGGTALKKCYFGNYRFSEDLDFTALNSSPKDKALKKVMNDCCKKAELMMGEISPVSLYLNRYEEKDPHPDGQEAFAIRCQFPWQREALCKVLIEVTREENLITPPIYKPIIHDFPEEIHGKIAVYSLDEIVLEKLRAILQHTKKLHEREWGRSRARDYYDLWHILKFKEKQLNLKDTKNLLLKKCSQKGVSFFNVDSFFEDKIVNNTLKTWQQWLGPLTNALPPCEKILEELKFYIHELLNK